MMLTFNHFSLLLRNYFLQKFSQPTFFLVSLSVVLTPAMSLINIDYVSLYFCMTLFGVWL